MSQRLRAGLAVLCMACLFGANVGFTIYWNHLQAQHACQALTLLTAKPVPKPSDPTTNPSREVTYNFYESLVYWRNADC